MTTAGGDGHDLPAGFGVPHGVLVLDTDDARLMLHLLVTFERLLQRGELSEHQLALLTPGGTGSADAAADLLMAQVVGEAIDALRDQLDEG